MSKRRASSISTSIELDHDENNNNNNSKNPPVPKSQPVLGLNQSIQPSAGPSSEIQEVLKTSIEEAGGPYWERILQMHGKEGSHSEMLAGYRPHELWLVMCQMYCDVMNTKKEEANSESEEQPLWFQLASKSLYLNAAGSSIRECEVIQAAYDAYNWKDEEDSAVISSLAKVKAPLWDHIFDQFKETIPNTSRTKQDIENRAVVLHRFYAYFHPLAIPEGLNYVRTNELNSFGLPRSIDWSESEDANLLAGIDKMRGPYWGKILALYGAAGSIGNHLASKSETDLANRVREWWVTASGPQRSHIDPKILEVLQYTQPKGLTPSGMPTSRGWSDEQDRVLISELQDLKAPNYNEILLRHGTGGRISEKLAPKNYAQLRARALKLHDFCVREKVEMPDGLQFAKRKE